VSIDRAVYARPGIRVYQAVVEPSVFELRFPHTGQTRDQMDTFAGVIGMLPPGKYDIKQLDALLYSPTESPTACVMKVEIDEPASKEQHGVLVDNVS
jgi:hypothetical protein